MYYFSKPKMLLLAGVIFCSIFMQFGCSVEQEFSVQFEADNKLLGGIETNNFKIRVLPSDTGNKDLNRVLDASLVAITDLEMIQNLESELVEFRLDYPDLVDLEKFFLECTQRKLIAISQISNNCAVVLTIVPTVRGNTNFLNYGGVKANKSTHLVVTSESFGLTDNDWVMLVSLGGFDKNVVLTGDMMIKDPIVFLRRLATLVDRKSFPNSGIMNWVNSVRLEMGPLLAKHRRSARYKRWNEYFIKMKDSKLSAAARFEVPLKDSVIAVRWIPSGEYIMGSPLAEIGRFSDESQHLVRLSKGFLLSESECTQKDWVLLMTNNPSYFKGDLRPVEQVNWDEAMLFCERLTKLHFHEGLLPDGFRWRLPTEAEWEYACRSGARQAYSNDIGVSGWSLENSGMQSHPVSIKIANKWGVQDMHGNVWEWCMDWYQEYPKQDVLDPICKKVSLGRVLRGGGWFLEEKYCRSAARRYSAPNLSYSYVGFRPVLVFEPNINTK
jgi:formylglycine-generating enzyme required for sulfatase activity